MSLARQRLNVLSRDHQLALLIRIKLARNLHRHPGRQHGRILDRVVAQVQSALPDRRPSRLSGDGNMANKNHHNDEWKWTAHSGGSQDRSRIPTNLTNRTPFEMPAATRNTKNQPSSLSRPLSKDKTDKCCGSRLPQHGPSPAFFLTHRRGATQQPPFEVRYAKA